MRQSGAEHGFTLFELLIVVTILGLIVVAMTNGVRFAGRAWQAQERRSELQGDLDAVQNVLRQLITSATGFNGDGISLRFVGTLPDALARGASWVDVFCDVGVFTVAETRAILLAARDLGLPGRLHAEEIGHTGAADLAAELGCASADHLEHVTPDGARAMAGAGVVGVLLPTVTFWEGMQGSARPAPVVDIESEAAETEAAGDHAAASSAPKKRRRRRRRSGSGKGALPAGPQEG